MRQMNWRGPHATATVEGFRRWYDYEKHRIWVYTNHRGSYAYQALEHGVEPHKHHPHRTDHEVIGWLSLAPMAAQVEARKKRDWLFVVGKTTIVAFVVLVSTVFAILSGTKSTRR